ncbi:MAG: ABC transporter permease, partial [bacterium]
ADHTKFSMGLTTLIRRYGTFLGFLLIIAFFWSQRPETFMTARNWLNITQQVSILCVVAFTMTLVMVGGDFDLSVGSMASLSGILAAVLWQQGVELPASLAAAVGIGLLGGLFNGLLVAYAGLSAFVATLGTLTLFSGMALFISDGKTIFGRAIPAAVGVFSRGGWALTDALTLPNLTLIALLTFLVIDVVLRRTVYGRVLYAVGGNREASLLAGVPVARLRLWAFVINGAGAAIAGLMLVSRLSSANPTQGDGLMLNAIASVFVGMTMSEEGEPNLFGTLTGVLILGVLSNGLTQLRVDTYVQQILTGLIIIGAVLFSRLSQRHS